MTGEVTCIQQQPNLKILETVAIDEELARGKVGTSKVSIRGSEVPFVKTLKGKVIVRLNNY